MSRSGAICSGLLAMVAACGSNSAPAGDHGSPALSDAGDAGGVALPDGEDGPTSTTDAATSSDAGPGGPRDAGAADSVAGFVSMGCKGIDPGNTDPAHAVPFAVGTDFLGCEKNGSEVRYVEFTTPATPAAGGYVVLTFSNVGSIAIDAYVYVANDMSFSIFEMRAAHTGDGLVYWFAAAPSTQYMVSVQDLFRNTFYAPWTLTATFTPASDPYKPNDNETLATPIVVGTPVQSLELHGYTIPDNFADHGWWSFYQLALTAAPANG